MFLPMCPEACWAAVDHPRLGGSTCRQSRQEHASTFLPRDREFSLASADAAQKPVQPEQTGLTELRTFESLGPRAVQRLVPKPRSQEMAELEREQCLFLCLSTLCISPQGES